MFMLIGMPGICGSALIDNPSLTASVGLYDRSVLLVVLRLVVDVWRPRLDYSVGPGGTYDRGGRSSASFCGGDLRCHLPRRRKT